MSHEPLTVCLAGATGFVGRHTTRILLSRGHAVRALVRDADAAARVLSNLPGSDRLSLHVGEPAENNIPQDWADRADAVVNTIGIIREAPGGQTFARIHTGVTRHLVAAASVAFVPHFLQLSALGVTDEGDVPYLRTKFDAEMLVRNSGLAWTILRPSMIHGPESEFIRMARGWATGRAAPFVFLPYFSRPILPIKPPVPKFESATIAPITVDDVALAIAQSLERPQCRGEVIHLCGPETLTWPDLLTHIRDNVKNGKPELKPLGLPAPIAAAQARAARAVGLRDALPYDEGMARMASRDAVCPMTKADQLLTLTPAGFRESSAYLATL